jgi:small subunit ribosomal protein S20
MPIKKAAAYYLRRSKKLASYNHQIKTEMRETIKKARATIEKGDTEKIKEAMLKAQKIIDRAWSKGVIKKRTAARHKSRLAKALRNKTNKTAKPAK